MTREQAELIMNSIDEIIKLLIELKKTIESQTVPFEPPFTVTKE